MTSCLTACSQAVVDTYCTRGRRIITTAEQVTDMRAKAQLYRSLAEQIATNNDLYAERCE